MQNLFDLVGTAVFHVRKAKEVKSKMDQFSLPFYPNKYVSKFDVLS